MIYYPRTDLTYSAESLTNYDQTLGFTDPVFVCTIDVFPSLLAPNILRKFGGSSCLSLSSSFSLNGSSSLSSSYYLLSPPSSCIECVVILTSPSSSMVGILSPASSLPAGSSLSCSSEDGTLASGSESDTRRLAKSKVLVLSSSYLPLVY